MSTTDVHAPSRGASLFHIPVGLGVTPSGDRLHVMDGDGASLCERVDAADLLQISELRWHALPISMRCGFCRAIMHGSAPRAG